MNFDDMTPQQLKEPVNGYQMLAVVKELQSLNKSMETIATQTAGVATVSQLNAMETELKEYIDKEVSAAEKRVMAKYEPMQKEHDWVKYTLIGGIVAQIIIAGVLYLVAKGA